MTEKDINQKCRDWEQKHCDAHGVSIERHEPRQTPSCFIQYKNTDICLDFICSCGAEGHLDGYFAHCIKCTKCGTVWEMPWHIYPVKADDLTYPEHIEGAKIIELDDEETP